MGTRTDAETWPWPTEPPNAEHRAAYADAEPVPFWLDTPDRPTASPPLDGDVECDLAVVGAGLSGLWAAVLAKERDPDAEVVVCEAGRVADAASGRNGGFFMSSLTHGIENGLARFPEEMQTLERLGLESFEEAAAAFERYGIDCGFERTGDILVALEPHEVEWVEHETGGPARARARGGDARPRAARGRGALPHLPGRALAADRVGPGRSRPPLLRARARRASTPASGSSRTPTSHRLERARRDRRAASRRRDGPRAPRPARDERLPGPGRRDPPAGRPRLRLRARERAARPRAARGDRLERAARASETPRTSSTTTG